MYVCICNVTAVFVFRHCWSHTVAAVYLSKLCIVCHMPGEANADSQIRERPDRTEETLWMAGRDRAEREKTQFLHILVTICHGYSVGLRCTRKKKSPKPHTRTPTNAEA